MIKAMLLLWDNILLQNGKSRVVSVSQLFSFRSPYSPGNGNGSAAAVAAAAAAAAVGGEWSGN